MVALLAGKGLALGTRQAADRRQSSRRPCAQPAPGRSGPRLSLSAAAGLRRPLPIARGRAASATIGGWRRPSTMRPAKRSTRRPSCSACAYPGGPAIEELAAEGDPAAVPLPRPLVGSGEPHFSFAGLKSAVQRAVASGEYAPADIAASFQQAVVDCLVDRTAPRARHVATRPALVVAGGVAANRAGPRRRLQRPRGGEGRAVQRSARLAVHGQCRDDRLGRRRAVRARADRCARCAGAGALAARSGGGEGSWRGGEGMSFDRLGVIGGGAWGTALAQVGASGGRDDLLWAREHEVVESVNADHENRAFLPGQKLNRRSARPASLPTCRAATPGWWSRPRSICAPCSKPRRRANRPLILCSKGIEERSGAAAPRSAPRGLRGRSPIAVLSGPTFAHEVAAGLPTAVTLACEDQALAEALRARIALPTFRTYLQRRRRRRRDRRRGQERARDRLRGGRRQGPRSERARRADRPRLCRDDAVRPGQWSAARDARRAYRVLATWFSPARRPARAISRWARASARAARPTN